MDSRNLKGKDILVIEANEKQASRFKDILSSEGIECNIVSSAADAISAMTEISYRDASYSIIVIGEEMRGEGNIFELASYLTKSYPDICLVLSSSADWDAIEYQAQKNGISAFIPVPFYKRSLINGLAEALSKSTGSSSSDSVFPDLKGKRILLVEDNMINREIAKEMLSSTGAEILTAENGKEAVDAFTSSSPGYFSIILMDIQMPVMDGYTATKNIRDSGREDADLPIFAMTANTFAEDIAKAKASGMNGHVAKPIDVNILMQTLRRALL
ncbi:MAG: response regulator [Firmicutes bacterium]|nr:response regulator [Bacillota bacterium]